MVNLELLRKKRKEKRLRQEDLSRALGKSLSYYALMENGLVKVSLEAVKVLRRELSLTKEESEEIFGL